MDWSDWTKFRYEIFPSCYFEPEPELYYIGSCWDCEETALNQEACAQARKILLSQENADILKLENDLMTVEKQLGWADLSWAEMDSVPLSEKVKSLNLSIRSLKDKNSEDDHDFGERSLFERELVEKWQKILKRLPEKYVNLIAEQAKDLMIKKSVLASLQPETQQIALEKNVSCSNLDTTRKEDSVKKAIESNMKKSIIADKHETGITVKSGVSWSMPETMEKEAKESTDHSVKDSISDDLQYETDHIIKKKSFSCSLLESSRKEEEIKQAKDLIVKKSVLAILQPEIHHIVGEKNISCSNPETRKEDVVIEVIESNIKESVIADKHETGIIVKSGFSCSTPETIEKEAEKSTDHSVKDSVSDDPQYETDHIIEKKSFSCSILETIRKQEEIKQRKCLNTGEVISNAPLHDITNDPEELNEPNKIDLLTNVKAEPINFKSSSKERSSSMKPGGENYLPGTIKPPSDLTSDGIKHAIGSDEDRNKEIKMSSSADEISSTPTLANIKREPMLLEKAKFADHISEFVSSNLETGKEGTMCKDDHNTENKKTNAQGIEILESSHSNTKINKSDSILEFMLSMRNPKDRNNKKGKFLDIKHEPSSDLYLESEKPKTNKVLKRSVASALKREVERESENFIGIRKGKKLKGLDLDHITALRINLPENLSAESVCSNNLALISTPPIGTELENLKLTDLRDMARQINLKGVSKFTKAKLIEEIRSRLVTKKNCT